MSRQIITDTATVVIFDPECLRHRLVDDCDWWSDRKEEVAEINAGNVLFVSVGSDGFYEVEVVPAIPTDGRIVVEAVLKNCSGRFFIGPGEYTSGEGSEPDPEERDAFVEFAPGSYRVRVCLVDGERVFLQIDRVSEFRANQFTRSPSLLAK